MNRNVITQALLLIAPILFVWHLEVVLVTLDFTTADMTNGFWRLTGGQVYHIGMYFLFFTCGYAAYRIEQLKE